MINIAQILNKCPKNTKLYSPTFGDVYLYSTSPYTISVTLDENGKSLEQFLCDGKYTQNGECMLFPSKEQRDWSKFQIPFRDGDVIYNPDINAISILRSNDSGKSISHAFLNILGDLIINHYHSSDLSDWRFATEEEKAKLFKVIKDNGYKWNTESKALEKLIDPKFKVGDKIRVKNGSSEHRIIDGVFDTFYSLQMFGKIEFTDQDNWELVPDKFDINTLVPFESRVLVRYNKESKWCPAVWGFYDCEKGFPHRYAIVGGITFAYCIPYEGNEHLYGKVEDCEDFYKTWQ